jgi:hypothetical protein
MADTPDRPKSPKKRGMIGSFIVRIFYIVLLLTLNVAAHTFVQYPENRARSFCIDSYYLVKAVYVDGLSIFSINNLKWTFERVNNSVAYKQNCVASQGFGIAKVIPNIKYINIR